MDGPTPDDLEREQRLLRRLGEASALAVAFSGGVDSSYLLAAALDAVGPERVTAYLGVSPSVALVQREQAREVAHHLAVRFVTVTTDELDRDEYRANRGDRCFFCKDTLFTRLRALSGSATLVEGTNHDDVGGHRPGLRAAATHGVTAPLLDVGLTKAAIRRLSRIRGLPTADLPASPCLASRFPAGVPVSETGLRRVEGAEAVLRAEGLSEFRVRDHGDTARIEVPERWLPHLVTPEVRERCVEALRGLGYRYVTLDLEGFRSGSSSLPAVPGDGAASKAAH